MNSNNYCVIMAGGIGSRFWPLSRQKQPKQFLDILGTDKSLIQLTFERFAQIMPRENIYIVTNEDYAELIRKHIPNITDDQVLLEPMRRNTAPCIAYAHNKILTINPNANIVVAPSDHVILMEKAFLDVVSMGLDHVANSDVLLTLGINPSRAETGYGYIQINGGKGKIEINKSIRKVKTFTEKPDYKMAQLFLDSGDFFWNSGLFFWSAKTIDAAFNSYLPDVNALFKKGADFYYTDKEQSFVNSTYTNCKNISIDYGIMEKADNVEVVIADFGWSDLGTWGSLYDMSTKDENRNVAKDKKVFLYESSDCLVKIPDNKLSVIQGLDDHIVVDTDDVLLICKKKEEQRIKQFVNDIKLELGGSYL